jgi:uncharacterized protein
MTFSTILILLGAGFLGGMANAMAGGASLVTFPAMMAAGLAPIPANASNAMALIPGNFMGAWAERRKLPPIDRAMVITGVTTVVGGLLGGLLLLVTPENVFTRVVPLLIGLATLIFAFSKQIQNAIVRRFDKKASDQLRSALVLPAALYGGYFGAGLGVILMAVLSATSSAELRTTNAFKNLLGALANVAAVMFFVVQGLIHWPETLVMMVACFAGGYAGARALNVIAPATMRTAIIVIGSAMTLYYAWRFWF